MKTRLVLGVVASPGMAAEMLRVSRQVRLLGRQGYCMYEVADSPGWIGSDRMPPSPC